MVGALAWQPAAVADSRMEQNCDPEIVCKRTHDTGKKVWGNISF